MRAILIDPFSWKVTEVEVQSEADIAKLLRCTKWPAPGFVDSMLGYVARAFRTPWG